MLDRGGHTGVIWINHHDASDTSDTVCTSMTEVIIKNSVRLCFLPYLPIIHNLPGYGSVG